MMARPSGLERGPPGSFTREGAHSISSASGSVVWMGCLRVLLLYCFVVILLVVQAGAQSTVFLVAGRGLSHKVYFCSHSD